MPAVDQVRTLSDRSAQELQRAARKSLQDVFPPNTAEAEELLTAALAKTPLRSSLWIDLARVRLYQNNPAQVREALQMSRAFDPGYIDQRIDSLPILFYLKEKNEALTQGKSILKQSPKKAAEVLPSLFSGGVSYQEIQDSFDPSTLDSPELLPVAQSLRLLPQNQRAAFYLPLLKRTDLEPSVVDGLISESAQQQLFSVCRDLTAQYYPLLTPNPDLLLVNPDGLEDIPFPSRFLGWRALPKELAASHVYLPMYNQRAGVHRVDVLSTLKPGISKEFRWNAFRFVQRAKSPEQAVYLEFVNPDSDLVSLRIELRDAMTNQGVGTNSTLEGQPKQWQRLRTTLSATAKDRIVDLSIVFSAEGSLLKSAAGVYVDQVGFEPVSPERDHSAGDQPSGEATP